GATWQKVLYKDENTGAIDVAMDPANPQIVFCALWQIRRPPWSTYPPIGGPGSGLYKSADGGLTWKQITGNGLPAGEWGRVGIAIARSDSRRVYALIDAREGKSGLYRSDDGGENWVLVGTDSRIHSRAWYFSEIVVDPKNPDVVYAPNVALYRSIDGGRTFVAIKGAPGGDDYHSLWVDPENPQRMIFGSDQGAAISVDGGATWSSWYNQPTALFATTCAPVRRKPFRLRRRKILARKSPSATTVSPGLRLWSFLRRIRRCSTWARRWC